MGFDPSGALRCAALLGNQNAGETGWRHKVRIDGHNSVLPGLSAPAEYFDDWHFTAAQESCIRYEMQKLFTPNCSAAYEVSRNSLRSPKTIMETRGVVIRHAGALGSRSAADIGLDPRTFRDAQKKVNTGQAGSVFGTDGRLHIFLNSYAFMGPSLDGQYRSLNEVLAHEHMHEGINEWISPLKPPPLGVDIEGFPNYARGQLK